MALFAISYDLKNTKDYKTLWDEFKRLGAHKPLNSFYLANLDVNQASAVRDHLKKFIDHDDNLMVVKFTGSPAFTKANAGTNAWIEKNCP